MRSEREVAEVLNLHEAGCDNSEIARRTGVPRTTVRDWVSGRLPRRPIQGNGCRRCGGEQHFFDELPAEPYAYLLGAYRMPGRGCSEVGVYSKSLVCLFPQAGPGPKHERSVRLSPWQRKAVEAWPKAFLRGLIHTDGCRIANSVRHGDKTYTYTRYCFSNKSAEIKRLFCDACDRLGIEWRVMNAQSISVARRASVERLDQFIGPKA